MTMKIIQTSDAPAAIAPYSQAVMTGPFLFVSGQVGINPASGELEKGFAEQTRQSLINLGGVLKEAGLTFDDVASVDVFLTDIDRYQTFNRIYSEFFSRHKPARVLVQVGALACGSEVEIRCIAVAK